jgi:hypothetical protein
MARHPLRQAPPRKAAPPAAVPRNAPGRPSHRPPRGRPPPAARPGAPPRAAARRRRSAWRASGAPRVPAPPAPRPRARCRTGRPGSRPCCRRGSGPPSAGAAPRRAATSRRAAAARQAQPAARRASATKSSRPARTPTRASSAAACRLAWCTASLAPGHCAQAQAAGAFVARALQQRLRTLCAASRKHRSPSTSLACRQASPRAACCASVRRHAARQRALQQQPRQVGLVAVVALGIAQQCAHARTASSSAEVSRTSIHASNCCTLRSRRRKGSSRPGVAAHAQASFQRGDGAGREATSPSTSSR